MKREQLISARKKIGKTQAQIALECGIDRTIYCRIETGAVKKVEYELAVLIGKSVKSSPEHIFLTDNVNIKHNAPNVRRTG